MPTRSRTEQLPLKPPVFHILLALSSGDLHGLGIADEALHASEGVVNLGPGTLYRSLDEMKSLGLVQKVAAPSTGADPRRKYYRITAGGRSLLRAEATRLSKLVDRVRDKVVLPEGV